MSINWICLKVAPAAQTAPWSLFHEIIDLRVNTALAYCKKCSRTYKHPRSKNDSNNSDMWKHYRRHERDEKTAAEKRTSTAGNSIDVLFGGPQNSEFKKSDIGITVSELNQLLLQTTVACNWPFDQFDHKQFRRLVHRGFPGHTCPRRKAMKQLLIRNAEEARQEIKDRFAKLNARISLALDCWTSPNRWEFMGTSPL